MHEDMKEISNQMPDDSKASSNQIPEDIKLVIRPTRIAFKYEPIHRYGR